MDHCQITAHRERAAAEDERKEQSRDDVGVHGRMVHPHQSKKQGQQRKNGKKNREFQYAEHQIGDMQVMLSETYVRHAELPCRLFDNQRQTNIKLPW